MAQTKDPTTNHRYRLPFVARASSIGTKLDAIVSKK
jgi:hypothetical protein